MSAHFNNEHKEQTEFYQLKLLSLASKSKDDFTNEYKKYDETKAKELYLQILIELKKTILEDNVNNFKSLSNAIDYINIVKNPATLKYYYDNTNNPLKSTNLVILACKHNKVRILKHIFGKYTKILDNLSIDIGRTTILSDDEDETCHNAFYYAIRSGNVELLETLIKWPGDYFDVHMGELDEILSRAYEELKLKNVLLSGEVEFFVENKLINLRFFNNFGKDRTIKGDINNIRERIKLVLENISLLKTEYSNTDVDEKFLFIAKFIAQNIHILKQQLKSTYDRLPWEEIEFCLVSLISSCTKQQEINLFYHVVMNKDKTLSHLENFAKKLEEEKGSIEGVSIGKLADIPKLKREKVVAEIISNYPQFEELYNDYQQIRDIHSLEKISDYIKLALSAYPKKREGQLIITRVLQVIGEYLKNTLESPKLSNSTSELFLLSLPKNTREVIIDLRNSLSHVYSLSKRIEIEESTDDNFFTGVQSDTKQVGDVITDILYNNKIKMIRILLTKLFHSETVDDIQEVSKVLSNAKLDEISQENFIMMEHEKLEKLIKELSTTITKKTDYEEQLFHKINNILNFVKSKSENTRADFVMGFALLKSLNMFLSDNRIDHNFIPGVKGKVFKLLTNIAPQIESHKLKEIAELTMEISHSVRSRIEEGNIDKINRLICNIFYIAEFGTGDLKWIEKLREKLNEKGSFISTQKQRKPYIVTEEKYNNQLALKLSELKSILNNNSLSGQLIEKLPFYKSDKKLQAVVEMLILDIMSILGTSKHNLENNLLFLDDNTPLLTGKCLRNHLAHDNALVDVLLSDPSIAVILNAKKLTEENIMRSKKKIGKLVSDDPFKLREKYDQGLVTITNQERMFAALEEGNLESVKDCLKKGTDINARNINSWTTLHFAAKGPNLEVIKFILDQNSGIIAKDVNHQNPLHIAAANGRKSIVEFFVKEAGLYVDDVDSYGKTPLHIAAQNGHKDTVEVLLENKANCVTKDNNGFSPLHNAIKNNHIDVAKMLLEKDVNADSNEASGGFTPLHAAAEYGYLELVNLLLQNRANVNARNDRDWTPLHAASFNGHLEVVNALILKGANINCKVINGCTPLHYAVENGGEEIVNILLKHRANVNVVRKTDNCTPLHDAAKYGHTGIVETLLKNKANASTATVDGMTPLHYAVMGGYFEIVTTLLKHGVNIHAKDRNNTTPLHYAASGGHKKVVELLIMNKAEIEAKDYNDFTPLHMAALKGHKDIINLLMKNNAKVNAQDVKGSTALHTAAMNGRKDVVDLLIKYKADINARNNAGITPLHASITDGHKDVVKMLLKNKAQVNARGIEDSTPLHFAVQTGYKEISEILIANGADINAKWKNNVTPLLLAIKFNYKEIVEVLIANGANVNAENGEPICLAVLAGYRDIVEILLKAKVCINMKYDRNNTLLHIAAQRGHEEIVNALIKRGADVDAIAIYDETPLHFAAKEGHEKVVELLVANGASVDAKSDEGFTPLHKAATNGHNDVVKVLLENEANINVKDNINRTPLEFAVSYGHLQVVKMLLQYKKVNMNAKGNDDWTILHIAAQGDNLEIVKYLVNEGSDINAKNAKGSKPIHVAAREGYKDIVEFFLSNGCSIDDVGAANQKLLHYAAMKGRSDVVKYLISQGANVNDKDSNGLSPIHMAANFGFKDIVEILLKNGGVYNAVNIFNKRPLEMATNKSVINLLASTEKLFEAIKHNYPSKVESYIKAGVLVDVKGVDGATPLHYATWKGYDEVVNVLLQNKANPNAVGNKGVTPLHYAAKFSHLKIVMALLSNGAVYNAISDSGKTPSDFTADKYITRLFKLVSESFKNIKNCNAKVIHDLNKIKDIGIIKAIMNARDKDNKTLIVVATHNNFREVEQLKQVLQDNVSIKLNMASTLFGQGNYHMALSIFKSVFEERKQILGPDNPGTLDIQTHIANVLFNQGDYQEGLNMLEDIFQKQKEIWGLNYKDTLSTRSTMALVLHRQRKDEEAFNIYQDVYQRQKDILGPNHSDTLDTQFHMALVLDRQGKYEEALDINRAYFKKKKEILGANDPVVLRAQNNIALVLANQEKYEEALKIYKEVLERKKVVLGKNHSDTLRTLFNIAVLLSNQKKYHEALTAYQEILDIQKNVLGPNHPDTLNTQYNLATMLFNQDKLISALKAYRKILDQTKAVFGPSHPIVLDILEKIKLINFKFNIAGHEPSEILQHLQIDINIAASNGDVQTVQHLLKDGVDANGQDIDGRTPLHYAVSSEQTGIVNILLKNGADVTKVTNKGNTPLHTATSKGNREIIGVLLQHASCDKSKNDFINAKTTSGGTTSLHVASKNGSLEIVKSLLKHGAAFDIENKESKTALNLSRDQGVTSLLKLVEELFEDAKKGNAEIINKLRAVKPDEFRAVTNARNNQGNTLLQVMIVNKHKNITGELLKMLKRPNQSL